MPMRCTRPRRLILGKHDFTTFRAAECQAKSPDKTLDRLDVSREGEMIVVRAKARSFLHSQVRSMVGSLKLVGEGKWTAARFPRRARCARPLALRTAGAARGALSRTGRLLERERTCRLLRRQREDEPDQQDADRDADQLRARGTSRSAAATASRSAARC